MIDPHSGIPRWRQLAADLRRRIASGELAPGADLPSEVRLSQEYGVGRATVRRAIAELRSDGLVDVVHGYGTRVRGPVERAEVTAEADSVISTRMPTPAERAAFAMADGVPMLVVTGPDGLQEAYPGDEVVVRTPSA
jgi:DNA-binding FadR family transcriptional regulator